LGNIEEARKVVDAGLAIDPDHAALLKKRGVIAFEMKNDNLAKQYWDRALGFAPDDLELHGLLALWHERHGNGADAKRHWLRVSESDNEEDRQEARAALKRLGP
jgi:tetratricopeptide (TPR) repeat protein